MSKPLANCPFCGSSNLDNSNRANDGKQEFYFVSCNDCESCGPTEFERAEAERLWNRRMEEKETA